MDVYENRAVVLAAARTAKDKMHDPTREEDGKWHASDLFQCLRQLIATRKQGKKDFNAAELIKFGAAFGIQEYFFGEEEEGVLYPPHAEDCEYEHEKKNWSVCECDGVICSADGHIKGDSILEFKTTGIYPRYFPDMPLKQWVDRTVLYCAVHDLDTAHIMCYFNSGRPKDGIKSVARGWTIEVTQEDKDAVTRTLMERKDIADRAVASGTVPPVETRRYTWECDYCPFKEELDCHAQLVAAGMETKGKYSEPWTA